MFLAGPKSMSGAGTGNRPTCLEQANHSPEYSSHTTQLLRLSINYIDTPSYINEQHRNHSKLLEIMKSMKLRGVEYQI